jgi:hypothetical protein
MMPDQAWRRGERKSFIRADGTIHYFDSIFKWGGWKRFIAAEFQNQHLNQQLVFWERVLSERSAAITALAQQGFEVELNCCIFTKTSTVVQIPAKLSTTFAALGVDLSLTFYPKPSDTAD